MKLRKLSLDGFIDEFKEVTVSSRPRRFCFVLGAGASVSSGIPTAQRLVARWEERLRKRYGDEHEAWKQERGITAENQAEHYSDYYEAVFDIQSDGPAYLEQVMEKASPSGGYAALAYLLCHSVNNMVLTTNFDHLAEDSVTQQQKTLPLVIGHESLAHYISADIKRPVIIKIHRDLLMDPKNRPGEINKLHANWEVHLDKVFRSYHPLFIGYAGNDKSLMEYLHQHRESFQNGTWKAPYWTVYGNRPLQGMAKDFMEAAGGYVIYGVDFDELMILLGDAAGFKMKSPEEAAEETLREHEALARKIEEVLTGRAGGKAAAAGIGSPADAAPEARPGHEAADPGEPERLNDAIGRITGDTDPASRRRRYLEAVSAFHRGDYARDEAITRQLTQEEPDNAKYHDSLSATLHAMKRYGEAEAESRRALELEPDNAEYHHSLAVTLHEMQRYPEAEAEYRRALELEPDNAEYHRSLGVTLHEMQRYGEAEAETRRALELEPDNARYHWSLGVTLHEMQRYEEAEAEKRRALALEPDNAEYHHSLAVTLHAMQRYEEAEAERRRALELEPDNARYHQQLGVTLHAMQRYEEAEAERRRALELEPDNARYHQQLGVTLHAMQRYEEAEAETRRALELELDNAEYHLSLAVTLLAMKRYPEAEAESRRALELEPDNAEYHRSLGVTLREMGRYPESEAEIRRAIQMDPKLAVSHGSLARTLHAQQRWTEAEAEARKAIQMDPNDPDSFETLAKLLRDTGREREAAEAEARAEALRKRQGS